MAADDGPYTGGGRVEIEIVDRVDEIKEAAAQFDGLRRMEIVEDRRRIDVAADGGYWRYFTKAVQDTRVVNVPGVEDVVDTGQFGDGFRTEQTVRVGDDANEHKAVGRV